MGNIWPHESSALHSVSIVFLQKDEPLRFRLHLLLLKRFEDYLALRSRSIVLFLGID